MRVFDLSGLDLEKVKITRAWATDDGSILSLNGNVIVGPAGHWTTLIPFSAHAGFFNPGWNILTVTVTQNDRYIEGGQLEGWVSVVPEPSALPMLLAGSILILAATRDGEAGNQAAICDNWKYAAEGAREGSSN